MERIPVKTILFGLFCLALFSCEKDGPKGDTPSNKFRGNWGICFDSSRCESVLGDGYMISDTSISKVELSGSENTVHQSAECGKCVKTNFTSWTYKLLAKEDYSLQGDSITFSTDPGKKLSIRLLNSGRIVKARIHYEIEKNVDTALTEYWTRLSGTFTAR